MTMPEVIRWGILGAGRIARKFAADLQLVNDAVLTAVGSRSKESADAFADEFNIPNRHSSYASLVSDPEVDVIYIATPHNLRIVEKHRERLRQLEEAKRADLQNLAAQIAQRQITIEANANAEGHLYGSVSAAMIAAALRKDNFPVDEEHVRIEGPLKELGLYTISLNLGLDINSEVKLWVVPSHTEETPAS